MHLQGPPPLHRPCLLEGLGAAMAGQPHRDVLAAPGSAGAGLLNPSPRSTPALPMFEADHSSM